MKYNKRTVETTPKIKIAQFDDLQAAEYLYGVKIDITCPYFGGKRHWFICKYCNRRVGILYQIAPGQSLKCRLCSGLSYSSQGFSGSSRLLMRAIDHLDKQEAVFSGLKRIKLVYRGRLTKRLRSYLRHRKIVEMLSQSVLFARGA